VNEVVVGIIAILVGAVLCFRGWHVMRVILPLIGAFTGFVLGGTIAADARSEEFLGSAVGWLVAIVVALILGLLAYWFFAVAVIVTMASIGFTLAASAMVALGVTWSWVIVGVAVLVAVLVAIIAIAGNVPRVLLIVLSALAGANAIVAGAMLLLGQVDLDRFTPQAVDDLVGERWWWYVVFGALAVLGIIVQLRAADRATTLRESWSGTDIGPRPAS
jgi:hypothetical protein